MHQTAVMSTEKQRPSIELSNQSERTRTVAGLPTRIAITFLTLFVAAGAIYSFLWRSAPVMTSDSRWYMEAAQDLADGSVDQLNNRSPGLPLFLILTGAANHPSRTFWFVSLILHFFVLWLLAQVLYASGFSSRAIILFGVLLLLPPYVENAGYLMGENLTEFTLVVGITSLLWWYKSRRNVFLIVAALAIAYSALVRPTYQVFAFVVTGYFLLLPFFNRQARLRLAEAIKAGAVLVIVSVVILGGYSGLNYYKFGYFGLTPLLGFNLSTKTVPIIERAPDEYANVREVLIKARDESLVQRGKSHTGYQYIWTVGINGVQEQTGLSKAETAKYMQRFNFRLIRSAPMGYLNQVTESLPRYWFPANMELANMDSRVFEAIWTLTHFLIIGLFFLQLIVLGGIGVFQASCRLVSKNNSILSVCTDKLPVIAYSLAAIVLFYTMIITCMFDVGHPRQRTGDALIIFMLFLGVRIWWRSIKEIRTQVGSTWESHA